LAKPIKIAHAGKFRPVDLRQIERIIGENQMFLMDVWEKELNKHGNS